MGLEALGVSCGQAPDGFLCSFLRFKGSKTLGVSCGHAAGRCLCSKFGLLGLLLISFWLMAGLHPQKYEVAVPRSGI